MNLEVLTEREVADGDEAQDAYDGIQASTDTSVLFAVALGAKEQRWRIAATNRLTSGDIRDDGLKPMLRKVAHFTGDTPVRQIALRGLSALDGKEPTRDWGKSILNPDIAKHLFRHKDELDLTDGHDLDLIEYVAWERGTAHSSVTRRIAERMYGMLPEERQAVIDGRINEYYGWDRSANRYFLLRGLMEQEMDADALEDAVLGDGDAWVHNFALARLTGWSTYQEEDRMSFLTFECERLGGYPEERCERFLVKMVGQGRISPETAAKLLGHAPSDSI